MKKVNILVMMFTFAVVACNKDEHKYQVVPLDQVKAPVLAAHDAIVISSETLANSTEFRWQAADFGVPAAPEYSLYLKIGDGEELLLTSDYGDSVKLSLETLNRKMLEAGAAEGAAVDVAFCVRAKLSPTYTVTSPFITVNVTTTKPAFPDAVYMIGAEFGDWKWESSAVAEMIPLNGNPGKFWVVRYFADPKNGFKWNTKRDWGGDFAQLDAGKGFTVADGNAYVAAAGFYSVLIDYTTGTITIEPAQVYGIGDCFGGWDAGKYPFTPAGSKLQITTTAAGELRIYAKMGSDWWRSEFIILDGKIEYRGNGGDQERVKVKAGATVQLDFNAGTGTIE